MESYKARCLCWTYFFLEPATCPPDVARSSLPTGEVGHSSVTIPASVFTPRPAFNARVNDFKFHPGCGGVRSLPVNTAFTM